MENSSVLLMNLPNPGQRSVSPLSPSPSRELRGVRLFRAISRKLTRSSIDDLTFNCEEDSRSSSTDSCSSTSGRLSRTKKPTQNGSSCSVSPNHLSSSGSDTSSETPSSSLRHRNHSTSSFRKVFQNLSITNRSQSCTSTKEKKKKKSTPKRILRPPVTYTYVRGLSGLPTQRIPRNTNNKNFGQNNCTCVNNIYLTGLNR